MPNPLRAGRALVSEGVRWRTQCRLLCCRFGAIILTCVRVPAVLPVIASVESANGNTAKRGITSQCYYEIIWTLGKLWKGLREAQWPWSTLWEPLNYRNIRQAKLAASAVNEWRGERYTSVHDNFVFHCGAGGLAKESAWGWKCYFRLEAQSSWKGFYLGSS